MLDLRTLEPARQSADRRVALVAGFGALAHLHVRRGRRGRRRLGARDRRRRSRSRGLPWFFAFGARWRLLDDALDGVPFVWRGDRTRRLGHRPGRAARCATLVLVAALGFPPFLALLACLAGAAAYTALIACAEARYERAILPRPHRPRAPLRAHHRHPPHRRGQTLNIAKPGAEPKLVKGSTPKKGRGGVGAADGDLEVQVRAGGEAGGADAADLGAGGDGGAEGDRGGGEVGVAGADGRCRGRGRS